MRGYRAVGSRLMCVLSLLTVLLSNGSGANAERTLAMIKPDANPRQSEILLDILDLGFTVVEMKELQLHQHEARVFYKEHVERAFFGELVDSMTSGPVTPMILERENAVAGWRQVIGPTDSVEAARSAPDSLRAKYGTDSTKNALHGSDSTASAEREMAFFFPHLFPDLAEATGSRQPLDGISEGRQPTPDGDARDEADGDTEVEAKELTEGSDGVASGLEDLAGLSKDEVLQVLSKLAQNLGEDIPTVVDRLNGRAPTPPEADHSEL